MLYCDNSNLKQCIYSQTAIPKSSKLCYSWVKPLDQIPLLVIKKVFALLSAILGECHHQYNKLFTNSSSVDV